MIVTIKAMAMFSATQVFLCTQKKQIGANRKSGNIFRHPEYGVNEEGALMPRSGSELHPKLECEHFLEQMEPKESPMRLREWLIAQIDSGKYAGLSWENEGKTLFKIPWKHAAKQDYRQSEDAALFKAWAVYKGKYREGRDRADPSAWKTRLRCALNKSSEFQEVSERSQLDISEPYKVYRIVEETHIHTNTEKDGRLELYSNNNVVGFDRPVNVSVTLLTAWYPISDLRLLVCVFYHGQLVQELITSSPEGCFILQGSAPVGNERIYGPCGAHTLSFPRLDTLSLSPGIAEAMSRLLPHLEKGVLVWVAPDGVYIKRFCQGRVYWNGPLALHQQQPNKLEREKTCRLLDINVFLQELQQHLHAGGPRPRYVIDLCFGEEFPDKNQPKSKKLITAQELLEGFQKREAELNLSLKPESQK
ncbi:interferon regulatory factor 10 isoform X1 [Silurus asotus]|uniref:Interferon regulatory factor 10 isoform X1 n=1 Tax=Silurus asotus TaxID=30991 RepID=A0AAD5A8P6_SILAS|nr:interferon regulatory factor 10 isoform X1 [Silurus asotus]